MAITQWFETFNKNILIEDSKVKTISLMYKEITKKLNETFHGYSSETANSLYIGSYGRGTETHVSDIDMLFKMPWSYYTTYNDYLYNGQSSFLQLVKKAIDSVYYSNLGADGQVVVIESWDDIKFELLPCFEYSDGSFCYADTNNGGSWKTTNPKPEMDELTRSNHQFNRNLKRLCRMARAWKDEWTVPIGGLLIDTLAYNFMQDYTYNDKSYFYYDFYSRDFFRYLSDQPSSQNYWLSPGARQQVHRKGTFEFKAKQCYNLALEAITKESNTFDATYTWRKIYGSRFPLEF